jgi:hypothetical protein
LLNENCELQIAETHAALALKLFARRDLVAACAQSTTSEGRKPREFRTPKFSISNFHLTICNFPLPPLATQKRIKSTVWHRMRTTAGR